jgi:hypothetical protein
MHGQSDPASLDMSHAEPVLPDLGKLDWQETGEIMYDRLHGLSSVGPVIDPRSDLPAYEWLVEQFRRGSQDRRERMALIANEFIGQLADRDAWPREARINLLDFVMHCRIDPPALGGLVDRDSLFSKDEVGRDAHASLLKCYLAIGYKRDPLFWLEQLDRLGDDYGCLIFGGLLEHGLDCALTQLPMCCRSEESLAQLCFVIPSLVDRYGLERICSGFVGQFVWVSESAQTKLREALVICGAPGHQPEPGPRGEVTPARKPENEPRSAAIPANHELRTAAIWGEFLTAGKLLREESVAKARRASPLLENYCSPKRPAPRIERAIRYHDYLAVVIKTDAEWSRRQIKNAQDNSSVFQDVENKIRRACYLYADGIREQFDRFLAANQKIPGWSRPDDWNSNEPAIWLYQPMSFVPFGHADIVSICLLDDFGPLHHVARQLDTSVEDLELGFCPELQSLGIKGLEPLCDPDELFGSETIDGGDRASAADRLEKVSQLKMPLLVFTKYKMDGLGCLGQALLFQKAIFKAIGQRVHETVRRLRENRASDPNLGCLFDDDRDLLDVRCCLLDLQGSEEIGTLFLCRNFSTALACVESVRRLTLGDLFKADDMLATAMAQSKVHRTVVDVCCAETNTKLAFSLDALKDNHVFRWTCTTLATWPGAFFGKQADNCNGFVEALSQFQTAPGHREAVESNIHRVPKENVKSYAGGRDHRRFQVGIGDTLLPHGLTQENASLPLVHLPAVLDVMRENLAEFGVIRDPGASSAAGREIICRMVGRDVVDMITHLIVPIPKLWTTTESGERYEFISGQVGDRHFAPMIHVLQAVRKRLCVDETGRLSIEKLRRGMKQCGVPTALRRLIESLYENFATLIADPFLFDTVLDLYDALATFHAILSEHLPRVRAAELHRDPTDRLGMLDRPRIEQLAAYAHALYDAMKHRLAKAYMEPSVRDMAIDLRGGLNQVLMAADAPLKCGLGLVRRFVRGTERRETVGGLTRIGFVPGAKCGHLTLGTEGEAELAYLEVDVPHILHAPSYLDYLHESFHLVLDALVQGRTAILDPTAKAISQLPHAGILAERVSEVFVFLMCRLFVFGGDRKSFVQSHLAAFGRSYTVEGTDEMTSIVQTNELLARLFCAYDAFPDNAHEYATNSSESRAFEAGGPDRPQRLKAFLALAAPLLPNRRVWDGLESPGGQNCLALLEQYAPLLKWLPWLQQKARDVYVSFVDCAAVPSPYDPDLCRSIGSSIDEGWAILNCLFAATEARDAAVRDAGQGASSPFAELDPLVLVSRVLEHYLTRITAAEGRSLFLQRKPVTLEVDFELRLGEPPWSGFLIDRGVNAMFCPVPELRRARIRSHIAMLKTFWNLSSVLRGRRLRVILDNHWPSVQSSLSASPRDSL